jgi:thiamine biosynthesis lipoprotein
MNIAFRVSPPISARAAGIGLACLAIAMATSCARRDAPPVERTWTAMGTFASVSLPARDAADLSARAETVRGAFAEVEAGCSKFRPDSDVSRLNRSAGGPPVSVDDLTAGILAYALRYAELSGGAFDPTVAPLVQLWGFHGARVPESLPAPEDILRAKDFVDYRKLRTKGGAAQLLGQGMKVDLGGIAKGCAVDVAFDRLVARGVADFMINLGGNIRCGGSAGTHTGWRIGVRHPFEGEKQIGVLRLTAGMAVATSGNYEQSVTIEGKRYTHIMDPRTGYPVSGTAAVTVLSPKAGEADAMSTALFVLGEPDAAETLARAPLCEAMLVPDERPMRILVTPGFRRHFTPLPDYAAVLRDLPASRNTGRQP